MAKNEKVSSRRARGSLSQEEILEAATQLIEKNGLAQLSMGTLAKRMNSGVTSIYWYFRSKDELLQALTDRVSHQIYHDLPPFGDGPWHEELYRYFAEFRNIMETSPVYREVFAYRIQFLFERAAMRPSVLRRLESGLAYLVQNGLSLEEATVAFNACSNFVRGFVILEHGLDTDRSSSGQGADGTEEFQPNDVDATKYPLIAKIGLSRIANLGDEQFESGLRLLIEGVRASVTDATLAKKRT
jgi:AcrR family transcriptional regulator